ncbi:MAG: hypothetical protein LBB40_05015 [Holophagales bacterium]|jgi:hypothetical protein|nr:hypothetical protein [Holophagales bacterium]
MAAQAAFIRDGAGALREGACGGRRRQIMTVGEEAEFLGGFLKAAGDASVLVAGEIKAVLEARLGRKVHETTVYRMLIPTCNQTALRLIAGWYGGEQSPPASF